MNSYEIIKSKVDRLINIRLTEGVQPEELANNIYLSDYKKISFYKDNDYIIGELTFEEELNSKLINTTLRYIYNKNKILLRIEEQIGCDIKIEWDRDIIEGTLISDIVDILKSQLSDNVSKNFINSLPDDLKEKIESAYCRVA
ncbi:hypothetical protein AAGC94_07890 [Clostridium sporogenes]|uniref:hypothetical protein n=1 Tax=Clostridium sporogenes TaxID=1509 RepID=UPI002237C36F|nr:hypothetical protein [Clostridium sporogenes]MCW6091351.1 hypothetical protein [Clostridium sporogenes]